MNANNNPQQPESDIAQTSATPPQKEPKLAVDRRARTLEDRGDDAGTSVDNARDAERIAQRPDF